MNRPSGNAFIRTGSKLATASLHFDDVKITRRRGTSVNEYRCGKATFKAFSSDIPEAVTKATGVTALNFQEQHEAPFWFALSPGQVAKELNIVSDLEVMDGTMARLGKESRKALLTAEIAEERYRRLSSDLQSLKWIKRARRDYLPVQRADDVVNDHAQKIADLSVSVEDARHLTETTQLYQNITGAFGPAREAIDASDQHQKKVERLSELLFKTRMLVNLPDVEMLQDFYKAVKTARDKASEQSFKCLRLSTLLRDAIDFERAADNLNDELQTLKKGTCPLCQQPLVQS